MRSSGWIRLKKMSTLLFGFWALEISIAMLLWQIKIDVLILFTIQVIFASGQGVTKRIGRGMHELAAKVDEYARGMMGPLGSTLFEELGLYYIGPVDGHNIEDLICVLQEVASLDSMGPVLVHVITEENQGPENNQKAEISGKQLEGRFNYLYFPYFFFFFHNLSDFGFLL